MNRLIKKTHQTLMGFFFKFQLMWKDRWGKYFSTTIFINPLNSGTLIYLTVLHRWSKKIYASAKHIKITAKLLYFYSMNHSKHHLTKTQFQLWFLLYIHPRLHCLHQQETSKNLLSIPFSACSQKTSPKIPCK